QIAQIIRALYLRSGLAQDHERQGDSVFTDGVAKQRIGTRAKGACSCERNVIRLFALPVLDMSTNSKGRVPGEMYYQGTIGQAADGFLQPVKADLLHSVQHESVRRKIGHCANPFALVRMILTAFSTSNAECR